LVGRQAEVAALVEQVGRRRLITLAGPGGVGKTRLALELGWLSAERFVDGVWFIELAGVTDAGSVTATVAAGVEARPRDGASFEEALIEHLRSAAAMVVIDNCEHVVDAVAAIVERVVAECPGVTVVATSREALGLDGEVVWPVPSLDPDLEGPELFRARMFEVDASAPAAGDDEQIVALCRRLDGIPLAIELAAGQTRVLSIAEIVERVDDRFTLLRGSTRGRMERHQTLRATVQWSYRLLEPAEQLLFDRFSVFVGGAALEAVVAVCADDGVEPDQVLDLLASLVNKSMLVADRSQARTRFRALETLRDYGREALEARDEATDRRDRHVAYFADWAERAEHAYTGSRAIFAVPDQREWDNLRSALQWAIARGDVERAVTITVISRGWAGQWVRPEQVEWVEDALAFTAGLGLELTQLEGCRAGWLVFAGDLDGAIRSARHAISLAPTADDPSTREVWEQLAFACYLKGDQAGIRSASAGMAALMPRLSAPQDQAFAWFMSAVVDAAIDPRRAEEHRTHLDALSEASDSPFIDLLARTARVLETVMSGTPARTAARAGRALELAEEVQSPAFADNIRGMISVSLVGTDSPDTAASFAQQLSALYERRDWGVIWWTLEAVASHWAQSGQVEGAAVLYGNLEADGRDSRGAFDSEPQLEAARAHPLAESLMAQGAAMSRDEVVEYCLARLRA
jgi:predicted ATPase